MSKLHDIEGISITDESLNITIDGIGHSFNLKQISTILHKASIKERETYDISPSGYGIHWPLIDED